MAKFELAVRDGATGEVVKTYKRDFMPVNLYIRFQQLSEQLVKEEIKSDIEMFTRLKELFCETFSGLTEDEYMNGLDVASVLLMFRDIINKSTLFVSGESKNGHRG